MFRGPLYSTISLTKTRSRRILTRRIHIRVKAKVTKATKVQRTAISTHPLFCQEIKVVQAVHKLHTATVALLCHIRFSWYLARYSKTVAAVKTSALNPVNDHLTPLLFANPLGPGTPHRERRYWVYKRWWIVSGNLGIRTQRVIQGVNGLQGQFNCCVLRRVRSTLPSYVYSGSS